MRNADEIAESVKGATDRLLAHVMQQLDSADGGDLVFCHVDAQFVRSPTKLLATWLADNANSVGLQRG